jgi:hypothetical protein
MPHESPLPLDTAEAIYDVLMEHAGAPENWRSMFINHQSNRHESEWRFQGDLGFGGKFKRAWHPGGERWFVDYYSEDRTPERDEIMRVTNEALAELQQEVRA